MIERWTAHVKDGGEHPLSAFEVSVCYGTPAVSWGWFNPTKIRIESSGSIKKATWHAEQIAAALNAAGYDPLSYREGTKHG